MSAATTVLTLYAPDISCAHCVSTVTNAACSLAGVNDVEASAETKHVIVTFEPEITTESEIRAALDEAGYPTTP